MAEIANTLVDLYGRQSGLDKYRQLSDMTDIITMAVLYNQHSERNKYRQLYGMDGIIITLIMFYY